MMLEAFINQMSKNPTMFAKRTMLLAILSLRSRSRLRLNSKHHRHLRIHWSHIKRMLAFFLLNSGYIVTILYHLPHVNACRPNEESHSILLVWIVFIIEIRRAADRVALSNMVDLLCHFLNLCPLQPLESSTP